MTVTAPEIPAPRPGGSRLVGYSWDDLAAVAGVIALTGDGHGHHIPGTPDEWRHGYIPLTEAAARSHFGGKIPKGWHAPPGGTDGGSKAATSYDVDKIVKDINGRTYQGKPIMARYRASAAVSSVTGIDSGATGKYGPMVSLYNDLAHGRADPAGTARFHAENFPEGTRGQADRAEAIAQVLDRLNHSDEDVKQWMPEHPAEVARAAKGLHEYAAAAREALRKPGAQAALRDADARRDREAKQEAARQRAAADAAAEAKRLEAERAQHAADVKTAGEANARGMRRSMALAQAKRVHLAETTGLSSSVTDKMRTYAGREQVAEARDHLMNGRPQQALDALDRARASAVQAHEHKARLAEIDSARSKIARAVAQPPKAALPPLVAVGRRSSVITAVDHEGTEHKVSLKDGTVTVTREGRTASAPAGSDPTHTARMLAGQLAGGAGSSGLHDYALHPERLDALMAARDSAQADHDKAIAAYNAEPNTQNRVAMQRARSKANAAYQRYENTAKRELRKAQVDNARRITEADKSGLPGLVRIGGSNSDGSITAVDQEGTEHKISLDRANGHLTVSTAKGALSDSTASAMQDPTTAARKLAARIKAANAAEPVPGTPAWRELADARRAVIDHKMLTPAQRKVLQKEDDRIAMQAHAQAPRTVQAARSWDELGTVIDLVGPHGYVHGWIKVGTGSGELDSAVRKANVERAKTGILKRAQRQNMSVGGGFAVAGGSSDIERPIADALTRAVRTGKTQYVIPTAMGMQASDHKMPFTGHIQVTPSGEVTDHRVDSESHSVRKTATMSDHAVRAMLDRHLSKTKQYSPPAPVPKTPKKDPDVQPRSVVARLVKDIQKTKALRKPEYYQRAREIAAKSGVPDLIPPEWGLARSWRDLDAVVDLAIAAPAGAPEIPAPQPSTRRRGFTPLSPMRQQAARSMSRLADSLAQSHPDMTVHSHVRDAARMLRSGNEEAAQRHLRAAIFALTPQSLHRQGVHHDDGHTAARSAMHGVHRHLLLVKDIADVAARNQASIRRDSYGDDTSAPPLPAYGGDPGALAQKPVARQPGGDRALNAPARTNSGGSDPAVADPAGRQPRGSKQFAWTWGDLAAVVELTGDAQHHHIPGSPYDYKHGYIPLTEAGARSHFHGKVPKGWSPPSGGSPGGRARALRILAKSKSRSVPAATMAKAAAARAEKARREATEAEADYRKAHGAHLAAVEGAHGHDPSSPETQKARRLGQVADSARRSADRARSGAQASQTIARRLAGEAKTGVKPAKPKTARSEEQLTLISQRMSGEHAHGEMKAGDMQEGHQAIGQAPRNILPNETRQEVGGHLVRGSFSDPWWMAKPGGGYAISRRWQSKAQDSYSYKDGKVVTTHVPAQDKRVLTPWPPPASKRADELAAGPSAAAGVSRHMAVSQAGAMRKADPEGLPGLVRVGRMSGNAVTAVDEKGIEHRISIQPDAEPARVTVQRETYAGQGWSAFGKHPTASAPAGSDPARTARRLAGQLAGASLAYGWNDVAAVVDLSARTAMLEATPAPRGKPGGPGLYDVKGMGHTPYLQEIVKALIAKRGMPPDKAYAIARGAIRRWSAGGGHVHSEVRAAAAKAEAGELEKQARAKAVHGHAVSWDDVGGLVDLAARTWDGVAVELATVVELYNPAQQRVPPGQPGGGQFTTGQQQQQGKKPPPKGKAPAKGKPQAKGKPKPPTPAQQKAAKKAALLKQAAQDRAKARTILGQIQALQKVIAKAQKSTGKTVKASSNVTKSNAPAKSSAAQAKPGTPAASAQASAKTAAAKTASSTAKATVTASQAKKALPALQQQYKALMAQAAQVTAQAAKL